MRVAVIGTGIAGNACAWTLSKRYPVRVYDREIRPGGHSHTVTIDYDGTSLAVDIGFIVYNELNYPDLTALFEHLGVETVDSCMSFAVSADGGRFEWKGGGANWRETAVGLFAQARNLLSPSYLWMLRDILKFNTQSVEDYAAGKLAGLTLGEYFRLRKFTPRLLTDYLAPMGAAIWSAPADGMLDFPAENFIAFFNNHRLLQYDRPVWRTVKGGSRRYVEKMTAAFPDQLRLGCAVTSIERTPQGVIVNDAQGHSERYDDVVIATHSDQALAILSDAIHPVLFLHKDFRLWQIYFISAIAIVFTIWSLGFVLVFRDAAGRMLKRASEIEALFPDLSARQERKLFVLLNDWYNNSTGFSSLRLLFWSTVVFYILVFASYLAILLLSFKFGG